MITHLYTAAHTESPYPVLSVLQLLAGFEDESSAYILELLQCKERLTSSSDAGLGLASRSPPAPFPAPLPPFALPVMHDHTLVNLHAAVHLAHGRL